MAVLLHVVSLAALLCLSTAVSADETDEPVFRATGAVPAGFEALAAEQLTLVDVFYGNRPLLTAMARVSPEHISFEEPDLLVASVPDLLDSHEVRSELSGKLDTNSARTCSPSRSTDCGHLTPEVAGVIYDAQRHRVDLFVAAEYRVRGKPIRQRYLEPSRTDLSFVQNLNGNFAGSDRGAEGTTISATSTLSHRENRLVAITSYSDADDLTIDRLFVQRDFEGQQYVGGLFRTSGRVPSFTQENDLLGLRVASSLETRNDLQQSRGTPIELFLNSRARVDIIKDGRLISTRFYDSGNQILDTSNLPEGAYDITIRISENGQIREETQFFTKTSRIPPRDQALFSLEAGQVLRRTTSEVFPEDTGAFLVRGGYSRRLTDAFGVDIGAAGYSGDQLAELGVFLIDSVPGLPEAFFELQGSGFQSREGDSGWSMNGLFRYRRLMVQLDVREVDKKSGFESDPDEFQLVPDDLEQANLSVQIPLGAGTLGFNYSRNRRGADQMRESRGINFRYPFWLKDVGIMELQSGMSSTDGNLAAFVSVRFSLNRENWSASITPAYQHADEPLGLDDGAKMDGAASWYAPDSRFGNLRFGADGSIGDAASRIGSNLDWEHFLGRTTAAMETVERDDVRTTNYSASFNTSALTDGDSWTFGGQALANSAVVIDLEGEAPETDFEVLVDGYRRGYAPAGRATAVHLPPFRTYEIRIAPRRANFVSFNDRIEAVTLYPGNVERLTWTVKDLLVAVGRVRDEDGRPLINATIDNAEGIAFTDDEGFFQVEITRVPGGDLTLEFSDHRGRCVTRLSRYRVRSGVAFLDSIVCQREPEETLPNFVIN